MDISPNVEIKAYYRDEDDCYVLPSGLIIVKGYQKSDYCFVMYPTEKVQRGKYKMVPQ